MDPLRRRIVAEFEKGAGRAGAALTKAAAL
jgi:hypothetical protein